jgi:ribosomal protein S27AE
LYKLVSPTSYLDDRGVNTFICPRCGQVLVLTNADKVNCSVCKLVIRVRGKPKSAHKPALTAENGQRLFGMRPMVVIIGAIALCAAIASAVWMLVANWNN